MEDKKLDYIERILKIWICFLFVLLINISVTKLWAFIKPILHALTA